MGDDFGGGIKRFMIDLIILDPNGCYINNTYVKTGTRVSVDLNA